MLLAVAQGLAGIAVAISGLPALSFWLILPHNLFLRGGI